jgi:hypothetical protein
MKHAPPPTGEALDTSTLTAQDHSQAVFRKCLIIHRGPHALRTG